MYELPLFPLNTVLFPGTPLQLHIFEERYKKMVGMCIKQRSPFGVVLIQHGVEGLGPLADPHSVGCTAQIIHIQRLSEGRMNIVVLGKGRFRILSIDSGSNPYLVGQVEDLPLENPYPDMLERKAEQLLPFVRRFVRTMVEAGGGQFDLESLPGDPISLAYVASALLQIPPSQKQELLAMEQAEGLLVSLLASYRRENALLPALIAQSDVSQAGGFSRN